jgi:hypothetical protein
MRNGSPRKKGARLYLLSGRDLVDRPGRIEFSETTGVEETVPLGASGPAIYPRRCGGCRRRSIDVADIEDEICSHALVDRSNGSRVRVISASAHWPAAAVRRSLREGASPASGCFRFGFAVPPTARGWPRRDLPCCRRPSVQWQVAHGPLLLCPHVDGVRLVCARIHAGTEATENRSDLAGLAPSSARRFQKRLRRREWWLVS